MTKFYLITFDNVATGYNVTVMHDNIKNLHTKGLILAWWHYLPASYIVKTTLAVNDLYNNVFPSIPARHMLIIEVNTENAQGWLPKDAWDWISKKGL